MALLSGADIRRAALREEGLVFSDPLSFTPGLHSYCTLAPARVGRLAVAQQRAGSRREILHFAPCRTRINGYCMK
jgi:hypothetical protein